ncbi:MAG TPA: MraY family glycosyltransferase [Patescibacteria group bacterium]|nr:MraY family glycosyltransferase [Patescibacteria group bacterium]
MPLLPIFSYVAIPLVITFIITALLTPVFILLNPKLKLIDDPQKHQHPAMLHTKIIPRGGGIPFFLGILISGLLLFPINPKTLAIYAAGLIALIVGVIDDRMNAEGRDVSPYVRFGFNIICAVIIVGSGITSTFITNPFGGILHLDAPLIPGTIITLANILYIVWIVWVMNILNWSKGVDGQMPGIVAIAAIIIGTLSLRFSILDQTAIMDTQLSFIIAGASIAFLLYNFHPAKIFPGYGATAVYLMLAVVSILSSAKLATAILVMGIPVVDAIFTIIRRILNKKSPFRHDKLHLHHLLLGLGYSQRQIALFYWIISAILGIIALSIQSTHKVFALIMLVVIVGGGLLFLHFITQRDHEKISS